MQKMLEKPVLPAQLSFLQSGLREHLSTRCPLYILADQINRKVFDEAFKVHCREDFGRPAKPIRLMAALLCICMLVYSQTPLLAQQPTVLLPAKSYTLPGT